MFSADDRAHMASALSIAKRGVGNAAPNPAVGCVLVRYDLAPRGRVVGRGWTQPGGRPHAETEALTRAGDLAKGAHAYVTLEPCSHAGQTGPCSEALIAAGVTRVTIAIEDPDERVAGSGIRRLEEAGIEVRVGLLAEEGHYINAGFLSVIEHQRPWVTLKTATSLDGAIASKSGVSKWITGPTARARGHLLRAQNDAIITGIGTVRADDPELTCRLSGLTNRSPIRVVLDPKCTLSCESKLVKTSDKYPLILIVGRECPPVSRAELESAPGDITVLAIETDDAGLIPPLEILKTLAQKGVTRVLVEAGARITASFIKSGSVDEIAWFRASKIIGESALNAVGELGVVSPDDAPNFQRIETIELDEDVLERYVRIEK